jgi:hypothetical protein
LVTAPLKTEKSGRWWGEAVASDTTMNKSQKRRDLWSLRANPSADAVPSKDLALLLVEEDLLVREDSD